MTQSDYIYVFDCVAMLISLSLCNHHHPVAAIMSTGLQPQFAALYEIVNPSDTSDKPEDLEIMDDLEGEQETVVPSSTEEAGHSDDTHMSDLQDALLLVSKGVSEGTDASYQR